MCLSTVFEVRDGAEQKVSEYVSGIQISEEGVTLTDIMGEEKFVRGKLRSIDLVKNIILVDAS